MSTIYIFDDCKINTRLFTLERLGETTRLRPKVFEVLIYLLENRDKVVSKQELAEQVWPDQFIADSTLESTIRAIRRALGDSGREQRVIQTLTGRGYRFIGRIIEQVEETDRDAAQAEVSELATPEQSWSESTAAANPSLELAVWQCPVCQHVNTAAATAEAQRCAACGRPSPLSCPRCGTASPPEANFCSSCGFSLALPQSTPPPLPPAPAPVPVSDLLPHLPTAPAPMRDELPEAERRQLTVASCDLVDAAALLGQLDLEDLRDVTRAYHRTWADVAQRFGGHIAQRLGTKLLIYFGYPVAYEDSAQRAVLAGLHLLEALESLNVQLAQQNRPKLTVRLGLHTGLVVVEEQDGGDRQETVVFGEPLTVAEQIQVLAPPDAVVISAATAHLVQGYFAFEDLGLQRLAGLAEPIRLSRVVEANGAQSRLDTVGTSGLTPFVGRDSEMALLMDRWLQVQDGSGHVVLVSGEAGIGKSRLVQVMQERIPEATYMPLDLRCSPSSQNSAMYPVIDFLHRRILQSRQEDTPREQLKKLETALTQYEIALDDTVPLLAALLSLPHPGHRYPPLQLTPEQQRERTLGAIVTIVLALASHQPVLLVVEDVHWIDPSSLELLTLLVDQTPAASICTLLTFRPTFGIPWGNRSYLTQITLSRLPRQQVEQIVTRVTRGKSLPTGLLQQVVDQTDGVPLFVEECTKSILETGLLQETEDHYELAEALPVLTIPTTLHDSLMARLDRLDTAKSVAQLGATIGRQVPYALLRAVWQQDEASLQHELERLVEAELIYPRGLPPQATYVFKHALIQEAAYQSLLKRTREYYHQQIAQVLDAQFPETAALQPELLAHHYTEAGLHEKAIPYWQQAGELAVERSANTEAVSHFTRGLELVDILPETPQRIQQELALQLAIGAPLLMIKGHTALEVEYVYSRAYELAQQLGETPQRFSALAGIWRLNLSHARLQKACDIGEQCLMLAKSLQDTDLLQEAYLMLGSARLYIGDSSPDTLIKSFDIDM